MQLIVNITQTPAGDIEVRMSRPAHYSTERENAYGEAVVESIMQHILTELPRIAKTLGAEATLQLNVRPKNS